MSELEKTIRLSDAKYGMLSLGELWESVARLSTHVVEDNQLCENIYPHEIRSMQLQSLETFIKEIKKHHTV